METSEPLNERKLLSLAITSSTGLKGGFIESVTILTGADGSKHEAVGPRGQGRAPHPGKGPPKGHERNTQPGKPPPPQRPFAFILLLALSSLFQPNGHNP